MIALHQLFAGLSQTNEHYFRLNLLFTCFVSGNYIFVSQLRPFWIKRWLPPCSSSRLYSVPRYCRVAAVDTILFQPVLACTSSSIFPICLSWHGPSISALIGLPVRLLPDGTVFVVYLPTISWSRLFTCPNHRNLVFLHLSVMLSWFSLSLVLPFLSWSLSVWPIYTSSSLSLPVSSFGS